LVSFITTVINLTVPGLKYVGLQANMIRADARATLDVDHTHNITRIQCILSIENILLDLSWFNLCSTEILVANG